MLQNQEQFKAQENTVSVMVRRTRTEKNFSFYQTEAEKRGKLAGPPEYYKIPISLNPPIILRQSGITQK